MAFVRDLLRRLKKARLSSAHHEQGILGRLIQQVGTIYQLDGVASS